MAPQRSSDDPSHRVRPSSANAGEKWSCAWRSSIFGFPGADRAAPEVDGRGARPPVPAEQVERERNAIRDACKGIDAGITLAEIAKTWNEAGLRTATGGTWDGVNVRQVLARPRNAGLIHHKGQLVGHVTGEEPIVDEELHQRVQAVFAGRRRGRAPDTRNYVATGLIYCGVCGNPLRGPPQGPAPGATRSPSTTASSSGAGAGDCASTPGAWTPCCERGRCAAV